MEFDSHSSHRSGVEFLRKVIPQRIGAAAAAAPPASTTVALFEKSCKVNPFEARRRLPAPVPVPVRPPLDRLVGGAFCSPDRTGAHWPPLRRPPASSEKTYANNAAESTSARDTSPQLRHAATAGHVEAGFGPEAEAEAAAEARAEGAREADTDAVDEAVELGPADCVERTQAATSWERAGGREAASTSRSWCCCSRSSIQRATLALLVTNVGLRAAVGERKPRFCCSALYLYCEERS